MQEFRKKEIRIKADLIREKCKVSRYGVIDLFKECERLGYKLIRYPLGENSDLGFSLIKDNDIIIFTNTSNRLSREIFTLAHEIGHVVLHMNTAASFIDDNVTISARSTDEKEQEANYFAACLLMPEDDVGKFLDLEIDDFANNGLSALDIARIMSEFNVSFDMALNRLENLGKIDAHERLRLDNEKMQKRVGNLLRSVGGNAKLNVASEDIDIPYEYIDYAIYNYNHNAIPRETLEKVLDCYQITVEDIGDNLVDHTEEPDDLEDLIGGLTD
ncbi:MAG TPA: ImmA/IrrE family metallo-endopeptidase [Candidatus Mediterraneibacter merdavium]|nr:ImmA/IrrE family metallo-endopeptidase [Candidatus Mediterraneibacter merdavium]